MRHRVARVHAEVEQGLVELGRIDRDGAILVGGEGDELEIRAEHAPEHRMRRRDDAVQVDGLAGACLLAAEREQPLGQVAGPLGGDADLGELVPQLRVVAGARERELAVAGDRDEQVVEVVGDPACELADGLELLRLAEAVLERPLLGDVGEDPVPLRVAVLLEQRRLVADPDDAAVLAAHAVLRAQKSDLERQLLLPERPFAIVLVQTRPPGCLVRPPLLGRPAEHSLDRRADVVPVPRPDRGAVDDAGQALHQLPVALGIQAIVHSRGDRSGADRT